MWFHLLEIRSFQNMNCQTLPFRTAVAVLTIGLAGCASEPPPHYSSAPRYAPPPPQSYGTVSVRYVQPAAAPVSKAHRQPNMERALADLQNARAQLNTATVNVGGHRQNALQAVDEAIGHVRSGIDYDNSH